MNESPNGNGTVQMPDAKKVMHETKIQVMDDDSIQVVNFPADSNDALNLMGEATRIVANFFIQKALEGKVQKPQSALLVPRGMGGIILPQ